MSKNLLIATLVGLSVAGLVACSGGENKTTAENEVTPVATTSADASAPAQPAAVEVQQAPVQTADASMDNSATSTTVTTTTPAAPVDNSSSTTTTVTTPSTDSSMMPSTDSSTSSTTTTTAPAAPSDTNSTSSTTTTTTN